MQIRRTFRFEAAHVLPFHQGKCSRMHGHSYRLDVAVRGPLQTDGPARGMIEDGKTAIVWNLPRDLLPKNRVKLLLNMLLIATATIPRGGTLSVDPAPGGPGFRITASGINARLTAATSELLAGNPAQPVDAHVIQPVYTGILARDCGLALSAAIEGEAVVVTAAGPENPK